jgi:5-methylcytosine-specific restriction enzyme A
MANHFSNTDAPRKKWESNTKRLRGYAAVQRRKRYLSAHPLCVDCMRRGLIAAAVEVDHIVPLFKGGADNESNFQPLCKDCHDRKTRDDLGWTRSKACDVSGMPVDPSHHWNK